MNDGWLVARDSKLAFWSDGEVQYLLGLPEFSPIEVDRLIWKLKSVCMLVVPSGEKRAIYSSTSGIEWTKLLVLPEDDLGKTAFVLDGYSGAVSYVQGLELNIVDSRVNRIIQLPCQGIRRARTSESGDWIAVGEDLRNCSNAWNRKATAWILREGADEWEVSTPTISPLQDFLIRTWYGTHCLWGLDVHRRPKVFLGESLGLSEWDYESVFVELESGLYRTFQLGVGVIQEVGRDETGLPFYTTAPGECMKWNGRRFVALGWREKLWHLFKDISGRPGGIRMEVAQSRIRGTFSVYHDTEGHQARPFASDDFGETWHRPEFGLGQEGWRILVPFVKPK